MKTYYLMNNIGRAKYTVNFHDGVKTHKDGSAFFDIRIFSNKREAREFEAQLMKDGYTGRN